MCRSFLLSFFEVYFVISLREKMVVALVLSSSFYVCVFLSAFLMHAACLTM